MNVVLNKNILSCNKNRLSNLKPVDMACLSGPSYV